MSPSFGPWATPINLGPRATLDGFWKRRMAMLADTRRSRPSLGRGTIVLLAAVAAAIGAVPTVLVDAAATQDSPARRTTRAAAPAISAAAPDTPSTTEPAIPREQLRYAGKGFDEWSQILAVNLDARTRCEAIEALGVFGANGYADEATRAIILAQKRKSVPPAVEDGQGNVRSVAAEAREAIDLIGPDAVPALVALLTNPDATVRAAAAVQLQRPAHWEDAEAAKPAGRALIEATRDDSPEVRRWACMGLGRCLLAKPDDALAASAVAALTAALKDDAVEVRHAAISSLQALGQTEPGRETLDPVVAALAAALGDADPAVREGATRSLANLATTETGRAAAAAAVGPLATALGDESESVAISAAWALAQMGPAAAPAVPALIEAVETGDRDTALNEMRVAMLGMGGRRGQPAALGFMPHSDSLAIQAADALGRIGPAAKEAIPAIEQLMADLERLPPPGYGISSANPPQSPLTDVMRMIRGKSPDDAEAVGGNP